MKYVALEMFSNVKSFIKTNNPCTVSFDMRIFTSFNLDSVKTNNIHVLITFVKNALEEGSRCSMI